MYKLFINKDSKKFILSKQLFAIFFSNFEIKTYKDFFSNLYFNFKIYNKNKKNYKLLLQFFLALSYLI